MHLVAEVAEDARQGLADLARLSTLAEALQQARRVIGLMKQRSNTIIVEQTFHGSES